VTQRAEGASGPLFLLDAMSLAFRAFFALPPDLATASGAVTNALHGFVGMLVNIVRDHEPGALGVAFDLPGDTFRHELVTDYKGGRAETPDTLLPQFGMIRDVLTALNVPQLGVPGYEADDVLATLATEARDRGCDVVVVTGDRDCFQLVEDPHVRVLYNKRGVSDYDLYDEAGIVARTGVPPREYPVLAALRGDSSDNLPGVPGVGEKTAAKLVLTYGDLDGIFSHLEDLSPKLRENLAAHEAQVRANATATPLVRDVALDVTVDELRLGGWDLDTVKDVFERYELRTVWRRTVPLLAEGRFGPPAEGSALPATATAPASPASSGRGSAAAAASATAVEVEVHVEVAEKVEAVVPEDPGTAVAALGALAAAFAGRRAAREPQDAGVLVAVGSWEGLPGRSPLRGIALVDPVPPGSGVWVAGHLLGPGGGSVGADGGSVGGDGGSVGGDGGSRADREISQALTALLSASPVTGHGVKELMRSLLPLGIDCTGLVMDTEVAAYLLDPSTGDYGIDAVIRGQRPATADGRGSPGGSGSPDGGAQPGAPGAGQLSLDSVGADAPETAGAAAAVLDALSIAAAVPRLFARLDAEGLRALHDDVERPLVRVLARMEVAGIRVDVDELRRLTGELASECKTLVDEIQQLAGHDFNVNSTPQLRTVLYTELGLAPGRKTKTGYSTDAATLETLRDAHPLVDRLLRYRELEKLRSTYGETLLAEVAPDGRIHASFRQTVARTGRISSERPNLHNIPSRRDSGSQFRRAFVPAPGCRFLVADYDQVELRVIAHLSGDPGLIEAFGSGQDIHRAVASGVYGVPAGEVTKDQRDRAKMVSYGLAYGMEAFGLARRLATSQEEASEIMERYFRAFPKVRAYMLETVAEARERGYTRTEMGRKRPLPDLHDRNYQRRTAAERQAMNAGIQGLAADIFKLALVKLDGALERGGMRSRLVLQVHDEVIVEAVPEEEAAVAGLTRDALSNALPLSVPLEVTMAWGDSWAVKGG
jgi:DNA polymerase-1